VSIVQRRGTEMTEQSRFNDSPSEEELIFMLPWRIGDLAASSRREEEAASSKREEEAASSREDPPMGCSDWNWKGGRRE
jgi:hypothetical protein